jgi:predicted metal-dependent enzyme (double-stranded beta helix superfamily)
MVEQRKSEAGISRRRFLAGSVGLVAAAGAAAAARAGGTAMQPAFDLDRFVHDVERAGADGQPAVDEVLRRAVRDPAPLIAALGEPSRAGLRVLHRAADLTILDVVWAPRMILLPHDHNMWATIGIYTGREDNILWEREGSSIEAKRAASLSEREVFALAADAVHSVVNPVARHTGAIHIYGGDFFAPGRLEWDPETLAERPFDQDALKRAFRSADERAGFAR